MLHWCNSRRSIWRVDAVTAIDAILDGPRVRTMVDHDAEPIGRNSDHADSVDCLVELRPTIQAPNRHPHRTIFRLRSHVGCHSATRATVPVVMNEIRCDNAVGDNGFRPARVGCVVPWYASAVFYSQSQNPTLAAHVAQAQASGLPGNNFNAPLVKTSNPSIVNANRNLACGDAPSIAGSQLR